tara:strand:+ start:53 stop:748 length:696 start_codon:yes stop_codon:yes gene_type:complete
VNPYLVDAVGYYKFNESSGTMLIDELGYNSGTLNGSPTFLQAGLIGTSINFGNTGSDQYAVLSDSNDLKFTTGSIDLPFSISVWVNSSGSSFDIINKYNIAGDNREWQMYVQSGSVFFKMYSDGLSSNKLNAVGGGVFVTNQWNHIVVTYDGSSTIGGLKLYYNNTIQTNGGETGSYSKLKQTTQDVWIANEVGDVSGYNANLDETVIYKNRELTSSEVNYLYNGGIGINL